MFDLSSADDTSWMVLSLSFRANAPDSLELCKDFACPVRITVDGSSDHDASAGLVQGKLIDINYHAR